MMAPRMLCSFHYLWCFHSNEAGEVHTQTAGRLAQPDCARVCVCARKCARPWGVHSPHENRDSVLLPCIFYAPHHFMCITSLIGCVSLCKQPVFTERLRWKPAFLVHFWDQVVPCGVGPCTVAPMLHGEKKKKHHLLQCYWHIILTASGILKKIFSQADFSRSTTSLFLQNFPACAWWLWCEFGVCSFKKCWMCHA